MSESATLDNQIILIDKLKSWTSFDCVKKIKGLARLSKVGHAGTLDPLATGLLIIATGNKTKEISKIQDQQKEYQATFRLGAITKSDDAEFEPEEVTDTSNIKDRLIEKIIKRRFLGKIQQIPPQFSALKINGKRAYKLARKGKKVEIEKKVRIVEIKDFTIIHSERIKFRGIEQILLTVTINCSKGTYIRSLARDLGREIGVGGFVTDLRRTKIGKYNLSEAKTIDEIKLFLQKYES